MAQTRGGLFPAVGKVRLWMMMMMSSEVQTIAKFHDGTIKLSVTHFLEFQKLLDTVDIIKA